MTNFKDHVQIYLTAKSVGCTLLYNSRKKDMAALCPFRWFGLPERTQISHIVHLTVLRNLIYIVIKKISTHVQIHIPKETLLQSIEVSFRTGWAGT